MVLKTISKKRNYNKGLLKYYTEDIKRQTINKYNDFTFVNLNSNHNEKFFNLFKLNRVAKTSAVVRVGYLSVAADVCC